MKILYLDCGMGAAGDMLSGALLELLPEGERQACVSSINDAGIPGVHISTEPSVKCGIRGTHVTVSVHGHEEGEDETHSHDHGHAAHHHSSMRDIEDIVSSLRLPEKVRGDIISVYKIIAEAESRAHGVPVTEIHFHEVGTMDAIADIAAVCTLMHILSPDEIVAAPVHVGCGQVECAHGTLPVPAPATAHILRGVPIYGGSVEGELCTPTGAALLKHFVDRFGDMPTMTPSAIGYGMGKKDFPRANCLRAILGESEAKLSGAQGQRDGGRSDTVCQLSCNVDDMTAEEIGFALEMLLESGALEAFTVPCTMKKSRPGSLITVLCSPEMRDEMISLMFRHTSTIGLREQTAPRYVLRRDEKTVDTIHGPIRVKTSSGYGVIKTKYEYDDLARIAKEKGISLAEARSLADETIKK